MSITAPTIVGNLGSRGTVAHTGHPPFHVWCTELDGILGAGTARQTSPTLLDRLYRAGLQAPAAARELHAAHAAFSAHAGRGPAGGFRGAPRVRFGGFGGGLTGPSGSGAPLGPRPSPLPAGMAPSGGFAPLLPPPAPPPPGPHPAPAPAWKKKWWGGWWGGPGWGWPWGWGGPVEEVVQSRDCGVIEVLSDRGVTFLRSVDPPRTRACVRPEALRSGAVVVVQA